MKKFSILATLIVALLGTSPLEAIQATSGRVDLVTIDVRDKDLAEVLSQIGEQVGNGLIPPRRVLAESAGNNTLCG